MVFVKMLLREKKVKLFLWQIENHSKRRVAECR